MDPLEVEFVLPLEPLDDDLPGYVPYLGSPVAVPAPSKPPITAPVAAPDHPPISPPTAAPPAPPRVARAVCSGVLHELTARDRTLSEVSKNRKE